MEYLGQSQWLWQVRKWQGKCKQQKVVGVEFRAGGGLHRLEKPGWSAVKMEK